jgi:hypothetical protein
LLPVHQVKRLKVFDMLVRGKSLQSAAGAAFNSRGRKAVDPKA